MGKLNDKYGLLIILFALIFVLKTSIFINANIPSGSMENTIMTGDLVLGNRLAYKNSLPQRGDIIIFYAPDNNSTKYIKRIIGLPGDKITISDSKVYINDKLLDEPYLKEEWTVANDGFEYNVPSDNYFVLGDNRNASEDARYWNNTYVPKNSIIAKAICVYLPIENFKILK